MGKIIQLSRKLTAPKAITLSADGKFGIENSKTIMTVMVTFLVDLITAVRTRSIGAIVGTLFNLVQFGNIIAIAKLAWEEVKDADLEETQALSDHFAQVLDIDNDESEAVIEYAVDLVPQVYELFLDGTSVIQRVIGLFTEARQRFSGEEADAAVLILEKAQTDRLVAA